MRGQPAATVEARFSEGGLWAAIVVMAGWHIAAILPEVISGWLRYGPLASDAAIWLVYAAVGAVSARVVLRGGGQSLALPLVACPILLAGAVAGSYAARTGFFDHYNWPFTVAGWFALVALWRRSLAELVAFFAANTLASAAMLVVLRETDPVSLARFIVLCIGVSILQIILFAGSRAVTATARRGAEAEDDLARTQIARLAAEEVRRGRVARYEAIRGTVASLLDELAAGSLDLAVPAVRQRIAVAVTRLRRYLVETDDVPDPLSHELQACADAAERRGVAVDLQPPVGAVPTLSLEIRRALTEPIIAVLAATATQARITVVASAAEVVVAVMADAQIEAPVQVAHEAVQTNQDREGELLWVQARWAGLSQLPS